MDTQGCFKDALKINPDPNLETPFLTLTLSTPNPSNYTAPCLLLFNGSKSNWNDAALQNINVVSNWSLELTLHF